MGTGCADLLRLFTSRRTGNEIMNGTKHSPGLWTYQIGLNCTEFFDADGATILLANFVLPDEVARLIAAAPEMLEALISIEHQPVPATRDSASIMARWMADRARAAIAKARSSGKE